MTFCLSSCLLTYIYCFTHFIYRCVQKWLLNNKSKNVHFTHACISPTHSPSTLPHMHMCIHTHTHTHTGTRTHLYLLSDYAIFLKLIVPSSVLNLWMCASFYCVIQWFVAVFIGLVSGTVV